MFVLFKREKFSLFVNTNMPAVQREKDKMIVMIMMMMMMMVIISQVKTVYRSGPIRFNNGHRFI